MMPLIHGLVKLAGLSQQTVEIEPGTVMNFWAPKETKTVANKKPNKPVVVFAHPFAGDAILMWFPQVLALTSQYSVYVPDFIFFGGSTTSRPDRSAEFQAECLARGLRKLGVEKCTVVGLSYGGMVGFKMAAMYPELVEALVASCTVIEMTESVAHQSQKNLGISQWSDLLLPETAEGVKFLFTVLFSSRKEKAELLEALVVRDEESTNISSYPQRIHLLWGDDDKIFNLDLAQSMKEYVAHFDLCSHRLTRLGENATLQWIENAGHFAQLERPLTFNNHLKRILSSTYDPQ
ncbi:hypothetical protein RHSIM_Rhsim11G0178300 [Rhododendron simsii]|uniref:AB hydrolase-1 domain-containing protein n=1 Tax=Rhododendron simsii TaxID=118357 RepID=A0A834G3W6_RHOSS|nr:hypothetical protein RHSIM_Rhsim11G0178300 [Rhododendron simsii]